MEQFRKFSLLRKSRQELASLAVALLLFVAGGSLISYGVLAPSHPPLPSARAVRGSIDASSKIATKPLAYSEPVAILIPAIHVHSPLLSLGLNPDGSPQVPAGDTVDEAGWYKYSKTPGQAGASVIEGHVDSDKSGPSVFYDLGKLQPSDNIYVQRQDGTVAVFAVTAVKLFSKDTFPIQEVYGNSAAPTLRLITCGGQFDYTAHTYLSNTVVFSVLIGAQKNLPAGTVE